MGTRTFSLPVRSTVDKLDLCLASEGRGCFVRLRPFAGHPPGVKEQLGVENEHI